MPLGNSQTLVRLGDVAWGYGSKPILRGVDLELKPADFVGVIGANGSGKSTLFRGLIGELHPLEGRVEWREPRPILGYVPQVATIDPIFPLTVLEVVMMGASYSRMPFGSEKRQTRERALTALDNLRLASLAKRAFSELSVGQKQRALIARAVMRDPDLILLDEPTSGADPEAIALIWQRLRSLVDDGVAVLMISHDLDELNQHVERILAIREGRLEQASVTA